MTPVEIAGYLPATAATAHIPLDSVQCMDALALLSRLPDASVDIVVTSPPYNMRTLLNGATACSKSDSNWGNSKLLKIGYEEHDDAMPYDEYVTWQRSILTECLRVIKSTGAIFYNHKWRIQGGLLEQRQSIVADFPVRQIIIWDRGTGHNHNRAFFVPMYEVMYVIAKPDFYIRQDATGYGDVWHIAPETDNDHPAPFPLEIPRRCILATDAQVVLDPFAGSGTTLLAAKHLKRHYIGCDISPAYVVMAQARLADVPRLVMTEHGAQLPLFEVPA